MSYPYITPHVTGVPSRSSYQDILEKGRAMDDQTTNLLSVCQHILTIARDALRERGNFAQGTSGISALQIKLLEARNALEYRCQRRNMRVRNTQ